VLQQVDLTWCRSCLGHAFTVGGIAQNTSLFRFHVTDCALSVPPTPETAKCAGGWMQEMERLGYQKPLLTFGTACGRGLPLGSLGSHALADVAKLPDVILMRF
jgi:hypothetical protein